MEEKTGAKSGASVVFAVVCAVALALVVVASALLGNGAAKMEKQAALPNGEDLGLTIEVQEVVGSDVAYADISAFDELGNFEEEAFFLTLSSPADEAAEAEARQSTKTPFYQTQQYSRLVELLMDHWSGVDVLIGFDVSENSVMVFLGLPDGKNMIKKLDANDPRAISKWNQVKDTILYHSKDVYNVLNQWGYPEVSATVVMFESLDPEKAAREIQAGTFKFDNIVLVCVNGKTQYAYR